MYLIKDVFKDSPYVGKVSVKDSCIVLDIFSTFRYKGTWKTGDSISREFFNKKELDYFVKEFHIKSLPYEIFDIDTVKEIIDYMHS